MNYDSIGSYAPYVFTVRRGSGDVRDALVWRIYGKPVDSPVRDIVIPIPAEALRSAQVGGWKRAPHGTSAYSTPFAGTDKRLSCREGVVYNRNAMPSAPAGVYRGHIRKRRSA